MTFAAEPEKLSEFVRNKSNQYQVYDQPTWSVRYHTLMRIFRAENEVVAGLREGLRFVERCCLRAFGPGKKSEKAPAVSQTETLRRRSKPFREAV